MTQLIFPIGVLLNGRWSVYGFSTLRPAILVDALLHQREEYSEKVNSQLTEKILDLSSLSLPNSVQKLQEAVVSDPIEKLALRGHFFAIKS